MISCQALRCANMSVACINSLLCQYKHMSVVSYFLRSCGIQTVQKVLSGACERHALCHCSTAPNWPAPWGRDRREARVPAEQGLTQFGLPAELRLCTLRMAGQEQGVSPQSGYAPNP